MTTWDESADVIVVGFGLTAGAFLARVSDLSPDAKVLVLERGPLWSPERTPRPTQDTLRDLSLSDATDHVVFDGSSGPTRMRKWWSAARAGGGSVLWYGQLSRFHESDLRMASLFSPIAEAELRDWPISFDELLDGYRAVESLLLPYGSPYGHTPEQYRSLDCEHWRPRAHVSHFETSTISALHQAGMTAYVGHTCLGGRAWEVTPTMPATTPGEPAAQGGGERTTSAHPMLMRPNWYARREWICRNPGTELMGGAYVMQVLVAGGQAVGVEYRRLVDGEWKTRRARARSIVLAASPLDTIRILLASSLPNGNGAIGRGFTMTQERVAYLPTPVERSLDEADLADGRFANVTVKDFYDLPGREPLAKCGKVSLYDGALAEVPRRHRQNVGLSGPDLDAFLDWERHHYTVKASFKGESVPWPGKRVRLAAGSNSWGASVPRLSYEPHPLDSQIQRDAEQVLRKIAKAIGSPHPVIRPAPQGTSLVSAHHHGGAGMSDSARDGVVDRWCQAYEAEGLFVVDASFMPTSGATNSSLTSMANAWRVAPAVSARV